MEAFLACGDFRPRCWEQLICLSANRAIVDEVIEERQVKQLTTWIYFWFGSAFRGRESGLRSGEGG